MPLRGADEVRRRLALARFAVREALQSELAEISSDLLEESRNRAPQLSGLMINTAGTDSDETRDSLRVSVFYREEYALYQHEGFYTPGPVTSGKLGAAVGAGRKFLERPFRENAVKYQERLARAGGRALRIVIR